MFFKNIYLRGKQRKVKMLAQQYYWHCNIPTLTVARLYTEGLIRHTARENGIA